MERFFYLKLIWFIGRVVVVDKFVYLCYVSCKVEISVGVNSIVVILFV